MFGEGLNLKEVETRAREREREREALTSRSVLLETRERLAHAECKLIVYDSSPLTLSL